MTVAVALRPHSRCFLPPPRNCGLENERIGVPFTNGQIKKGFGFVKNTLLAGVAVATLFLVSGQANADSMDVSAADSMGMYVSVFAGASFPRDLETVYGTTIDYTLGLKTGYLIGGAIGMNVTDMIRGEVELSHSRWDANEVSYEGMIGGPSTADGSIKATYLLANLWGDFENDSSFTPYVGGGAGVGWADGNVTHGGAAFGHGDGEMGFAFQLGAGVKFDLTDNVLLDLGYRYKSILSVDFDDTSGVFGPWRDGDVNSHNVQLGLTFNF
jgi:opacity protein-like surface antigen